MSKSTIRAKPVRRPVAGKIAAKKLGSYQIVTGQIHGHKNEAHVVKYSPGELIKVIHHGLPVQELDVLQTSLGVPMDKLAPMLGMSKATLHRRKAQGRLDPQESDRVLRFARLMGKAVEVMESEDAARRWMASSQVGLGGAVPLDYAETEVGAREVEDLLGRIEYGVYS